MSNSVQPHGRQPTRLLCPWDFPGKNTGVGCHFLLQCMKVQSESEVAQSCPTLSDPMDCNVSIRRWRNRMGRPLSPLQIHWKNIWTLSKFHKTTSEYWQRTSGTQEGSPLSSKGGRANIKDKKRDKRGRDGDPSWDRSVKREVSKHQETLSPAGLWGILESQRAT